MPSDRDERFREFSQGESRLAEVVRYVERSLSALGSRIEAAAERLRRFFDMRPLVERFLSTVGLTGSQPAMPPNDLGRAQDRLDAEAGNPRIATLNEIYREMFGRAGDATSEVVIAKMLASNPRAPLPGPSAARLEKEEREAVEVGNRASRAVAREGLHGTWDRLFSRLPGLQKSEALPGSEAAPGSVRGGQSIGLSQLSTHFRNLAARGKQEEHIKIAREQLTEQKGIRKAVENQPPAPAVWGR